MPNRERDFREKAYLDAVDEDWNTTATPPADDDEDDD